MLVALPLFMQWARAMRLVLVLVFAVPVMFKTRHAFPSRCEKVQERQVTSGIYAVERVVSQLRHEQFAHVRGLDL